MLASSPSTIAETELSLERPEAPVGPKTRWKRPGAQRLGIGAWFAIGWMLLVILGSIFIPMFFHSNAIDNLSAGNSSKGLFKVTGHPLGFDRNGNDMLLQLAKGA